MIFMPPSIFLPSQLLFQHRCSQQFVYESSLMEIPKFRVISSPAPHFFQHSPSSQATCLNIPNSTACISPELTAGHHFSTVVCGLMVEIERVHAWFVFFHSTRRRKITWEAPWDLVLWINFILKHYFMMLGTFYLPVKSKSIVKTKELFRNEVRL